MAAKMPPNKKNKAEKEPEIQEEKGIENLLNEANHYAVKMTKAEIEAAENIVMAFLKNGGDLDALHEATKFLQRHDHLLPVKDQFAKYPWLKKVIFTLKFLTEN